MQSSRHVRTVQKLLALWTALVVLAACGGAAVPTTPATGDAASSGAEASAGLSAADAAATATTAAGVQVSKPVEGKENVT